MVSALRLALLCGSIVGVSGAAAQEGAMPPLPRPEPLPPAEGAGPGAAGIPVRPDEKADRQDLVALAGASGGVFDGVLVAKRTTTPPGMRVLVTEYTFHVHEWFKTGANQAPLVVSIRETGGENPDGSGVSTVESHKLVTGGRYLVYLRPGYNELLFPMSRVLQVMDAGSTVADEEGRVVIGVAGGRLLTRDTAELPSLSYLGNRPAPPGPVDAGPPQWASEPLPARPLPPRIEDHGPIPAAAIFDLIRPAGVPAPSGLGPVGLQSSAQGGPRWNWCGYRTAAHNFAGLIPDNNHFAWFNDAELDWDTLVNYSGAGGWLFGWLTAGGNPIRNELPVAGNGRDNAGVPSSAQMVSGGYGSWAANNDPNGICFNWYTNSGCFRITESDVFIHPGNTTEAQFRKSVVHEMGHSLGFGHEDREVAIMVSGTWRVPPNYVLGSYYNRRDETQGGRDVLTWSNNNAGASWSLAAWRDMGTVAQCHPNWGTPGDVGPNVSTLSTFSASTGQTVQLQRLYTENRGNLSYGGPVTQSFYLSTNTTISTGDYLIGTAGWNTYPAEGVSNNYAVNCTIPASVPSGVYYIGWILSSPEAQLITGNDTAIMVADSSGSFAPRTIQITNSVAANNTCATALDVGVGTYTGSTAGSTADGGSTCGSSDLSPDVYYAFTAPCSGTLTVDTCGSTYDTVLSIHGSCPANAASSLACNDDDCFCGGSPCRQSLVSTAVTGGVRYLIRVSGYNGLSGAYTLNVNFSGAVPSNDHCAAAIVIGDGAYAGSTGCATADGSAACGSSATTPDVWYRYTPIADGSLHVDTCGSGYDTVLSVHTGCSGTVANAIGCDDDGCGYPNSALDVTVTGGIPYYIRVSGYNGSTGTFALNTSFHPGNDACSNAFVISNGATPFSTVGATTDGPTEPSCPFCCNDPQVNQDIWYTYTATCTGDATLSLCGASYDTKVAVYAGICPGSAGTALACNDDATCGNPVLQSVITFPVTAGSVYTVRVGGYSTNTGTGTIDLSCAGGPVCYANCDASTTAPILNVADFTCFLQRFAGGDPYANCDQSTTAPVLNVADFTCFLQAFAGGCP